MTKQTVTTPTSFTIQRAEPFRCHRFPLQCQATDILTQLFVQEQYGETQKRGPTEYQCAYLAAFWMSLVFNGPCVDGRYVDAGKAW